MHCGTARACSEAQSDFHRTFFAHAFHTLRTSISASRTVEVRAMDAVYILMLVGLYLVTHGLVWAVARLGAKR